MKEFIINQITPTVTTILATAITAILVFVVKKVSGPTTQLLITKKKEAEIKLKDTGHESDLKHALEVWKVVDDKFRISENAMVLFGSKEKLFEQLLLDRIPGLTQKNIDDLRDAISGEVNQGRKTLITSDDTQSKLVILQDENKELVGANIDLQSKLDGINKYISTLTTNSNTKGQNVLNSNANAKDEELHC
jgi:hypothetical protein